MKLAWWLATVVAVSLVAIFLSELGTTDPVRNLSLTVTAPVQGSLRDATEPVNDIFAGITNRGELAEENEQLRDQVEQLQAQLAGYEDSQLRIAELEAAVGVKQSRPEDTLEAANVIAEDTAGVKRLVAIDKGERDGLDEGMVVLSKNGSLIGTIAQIYSDFAWVRLITDPDSAVNTQIGVTEGGTPPPDGAQVVTPATPTPAAAAPLPQASSTPQPPAAATPAPAESALVRAVARGDLHRSILLDLIPSGAGVLRGDIVITSGHGGNFPRGLLVGAVNEIEVRPQAPFKVASVDPAADLSGLDTVLVLTSFMPARLTTP
jgi:rod shape-determining protein MreC